MSCFTIYAQLYMFLAFSPSIQPVKLSAKLHTSSVVLCPNDFLFPMDLGHVNLPRFGGQ